MKLLPVSLHLLFHLLSKPRLLSAECYLINGTRDPSLEIQPCNRYQFSTCCAINKTTVGKPFVMGDDLCNANGLCQNWQTEGDKTWDSWFRGGCSDPTWENPNCLKGADNCCQNSSATFKLAATAGATTSSVLLLTSSASSLSSTLFITTPISLSMSPSSAQASATSSPSPGFSKLGVGLGVTFGFLVLASLVAGLVYWRRTQKKKTSHGQGKEDNNGPSELATKDNRPELEATRVVVEADGAPVSELP
ncbi:hypothetical protein CC86DRAFT_381364 [Ophiobolus disseminans]|uniref:Mid2 domain-containing protein n=1 Tax=Ophiobolus disseminans TaxID=1469910 RepID=A0A6A7A1Y7_9PLEO|nr:hypothetical protein CC86DRAFT_381364 [Ophiobolus disseminans]